MKKKRLWYYHHLPTAYFKVLTVMKLTVLLLMLSVCQVMAKAKAQEKVTLNLNKASISQVLSAIEKQGFYRFVYNSSLIDLKQKTSIDAKDASIDDVLKNLFTRTVLSYNRLDDNLIVIMENEALRKDITVTGKVSDASGNPLPGASVTIKGTSKGVTTDANGEYTISAPESATLVISSVGFKTQEIAINNQTKVDAYLEPSTTQQLNEVVVIGYGTANKRDLTGSIVRVGGKEIADKPNTNPVASLQGKVAGLSIVNDGKPGQEPDIRIRGTISRFQTKPLYVVDGLLNDNINFLNPSDIESMEILKDPSSLAIFGVRGANGVIIVTTKKAKSGQTTVNFNTSFGIKKIVDKVQMTDAAGFKTLFDEQREVQGTAPFSYYDKFTGNSDWVDLISKDNPMISNTNLSISNGSEKNKFYMGVGYLKEEGLIRYETLDKIILTLNNELKISKNIKVGFNFNGYKANLPQLKDFSSAINATPIVEPFNTEHSVYNKLPNEIGGPQIGNPLLFEAYKNTDISKEYRAIGSVFAEVNFLKDLTFRATYYGDFGFNNQRRYTPLINVYSAEDDIVAPQGGYTLTEVYQKENRFTKLQQEYLLTYKKDFGEHSLTAMGGFTTYYSGYTETNGRVRQSATGTAIPYDKRFWYLDNFFGDPSTRVSGISTGDDIFGNPLPLEWDQTTVSLLFRALYNYKSKYLINASFRRDGSSEISPSNRYQNFIAVGAAWELTQEDFMKDQHIFDFLKLKGSWGILGNQYVGIHYPFYPQLIGGQTAVFGNNLIPAYTPAYLADPNLKWETVTSFEGGIELAVLKNRLRFDANYFHKVTDNLLTIFPGVGGTKPGITNAGKVRNMGIEASASWSDKLANGFGYTISGNITTLNNKVLSLYRSGFEIIDGASRTTEGYPIGYFYGYEVEGVYQSYADKLKSPVASSLGDYGPGDLKFKDQNNDNIIDDKDRKLIGNPTPDFIYGFSLGANYKGFDVSIDFQGSYGNEIYRDWGNGSTFAPFNYRVARLERWTGAGTSNWEYGSTGHSINRNPSTYMIEDGSYLRIRNLQLGYSFSVDLLTRVKIKNLRVFVNAQNLKTFKNNSGFTPEFGGSAIRFGVDGGSYPVPAIYSAGLNVSF
ncbi:MAG: TonB-dependent receptor [Agriterribacter sp.]